MPWKNGGGETAEIAIAPLGSGLQEFDWRISIARVDGDGPFSVFDGIDRTLTILRGAGMSLDVRGYAARELTPESEPFSFPADIATTATLLAGPITDLNVMTRRGRAVHCVARHLLDGGVTVPATSAHTFLVCAAGTVRFETASGIVVLNEMDTLRASAEDSPLRLTANAPSVVLAIAIDPART